MATTDYSSSFPDSLYGGNTQNERMSQDAEVIARARDYNIHDEEIKAIEEAIGTHPEGTDPTGSIHQRIYDLEQQSQDLDSLPASSVTIDTTGAYGQSIINWMEKIYGTGDIDGDGLQTVRDILYGLTANKEVFDDVFMVGFESPLQGAGAGVLEPVSGTFTETGEGGNGGGYDDPTGSGKVWAGLGETAAGSYDQPVGVVLDTTSGDHYAVKRYRDAGGTELTGLVDASDVRYVDVWGTPTLADNFTLLYFRRPFNVGVADENGVQSSSIGQLTFDSAQVDLTPTDEGMTLDFGAPIFEIALEPGSGMAVETDWQCGWVIALSPTDASVLGRIPVLDGGTYDLYIMHSASVANAGGAQASFRTNYSVVSPNAAGEINQVPTAADVALTPAANAYTMKTDRLVQGISIASGDLFKCSVINRSVVDFTGWMSVHGLYLQRTAFA